MTFEWDDNKAARNQSSHGVAFAEAATVFDDPYFVVFNDDTHSFGEQRYLIIGESNQKRVLLVVYTERGDAIRLISARPATTREEKVYEEEKYGSIQ
jgi:uncharacterized protein